MLTDAKDLNEQRIKTGEKKSEISRKKEKEKKVKRKTNTEREMKS